ncbi:hypothetical protein GCM10010203_47420 [Actinomadura yumaensis]
MGALADASRSPSTQHVTTNGVRHPPRLPLAGSKVEDRLDAQIFVDNEGRLVLIGEWLEAIVESLSASNSLAAEP